MSSLKLYLVLCAVFLLQGSKSAPSKSKPAPDIVGGWIAKRGQFPYQLSLRYTKRNHFCGASILDNQHAITAGHCGNAMWTPYNQFYIAAGSTNLSDSKNVFIAVKDVIIHEGFDYSTLENDVAILKLSKKLKFNKYIKPIKLTSKKVKPNTKCTISGWGVWQEGSSTIHDQQKGASVPIVSSKTCVKDYSSTPWTVYPLSMVCAGYKNGGTDTCQGDSGGPLVCNKKLTGITSWGKGCAEAGYPGVYTNVYTYRKWIKKHGVKLLIDDDDDGEVDTEKEDDSFEVDDDEEEDEEDADEEDSEEFADKEIIDKTEDDSIEVDDDEDEVEEEEDADEEDSKEVADTEEVAIELEMMMLKMMKK